MPFIRDIKNNLFAQTAVSAAAGYAGAAAYNSARGTNISLIRVSAAFALFPAMERLYHVGASRVLPDRVKVLNVKVPFTQIASSALAIHSVFVIMFLSKTILAVPRFIQVVGVLSSIAVVIAATLRNIHNIYPQESELSLGQRALSPLCN